MAAWALGLDDPCLTLDVAGGKGAALGRLLRAGLPVPPGFVVTTDAYRVMVGRHALADVVAGATRQLDPDVGPATEAASAQIRAAFSATTVPQDLAEAIGTAYERLGGGPVAVRSSATAEDLPDLSFAGQQDTYLNVVGAEAVGRAVLDCWSSLWTARAIAYRHRAGIAPDSVAIAVVVQRMVPADVSGVLFTADPLTGHRGRMAIEATFGLGEALVSGQVEPDHIEVECATGSVLSRTVGAKAVATSLVPGGGVATVAREPGGGEVLTDAQVGDLVRLGSRVASEGGGPQDVEWAMHDGQLALLQARPITSLYPLPTDAPADSLFLSFGAVQGMLAPMTPLGRDAVRCVLSGAARLFGATVEPTTNPYLRDAGERIWIRLDRALRNPVGRRVVPAVLRFVDPSAGAIVGSLLPEPFLAPRPGHPARHTVAHLARFAGRVLPHVPMTLARPDRARDRFDRTVAALVDAAARRQLSIAADPDPLERAAARVRALADSLGSAFPTLAPRAGPMILPSVAALPVITRLLRDDRTHGEPRSVADGHGVSALVMETTRAMPRNVTTEMDLALWRVAETVRADPASLHRFAGATAAELAKEYAVGRLPARAQSAVAGFLRRYGMRGVGEIDLGRPRWREEPGDLLATVQRYLSVADEHAPPQVFARGEQAAREATRRAVALAATRPFGRLRAGAVRFAVSRVRALAGVRESPKFTVVQILGTARESLLASGDDLVALGVVEDADDIFLLTLEEVAGLPDADLGGLRERITSRRSARASELRRRLVPRVLVGDGRTYFEGLGVRSGDDGVITGSPVSPGVVEAAVRVVHDPADAPLRPGEVLVCPGTDPAWTPLFLTAGGLVTEVGGMMTHGSVVAREYGIPAVVGVHEATTRLHTGQRIRLDGAAGTIRVVEP